MKKLFFIIPLGISMAAIGCNNASTQTAEIETAPLAIEEQVAPQTTSTNENVDVDAFEKLVAKGNGQVLDVRTPGEWDSGTIKGANKINFYDKDFQEQVKKLNKEEPVYVYCKSGGRSGQAAKKMEKMGFKKIYNLSGGMDAWKSKGKKVVK